MIKNSLKYFVLLYYFAVIFFLFKLPYFEVLTSFSDLTMNAFLGILIFILPIFPIILRYIFRISMQKSVIYSFLFLLFYLLSSVCVGYGITECFKNFSTESWNDEKICHMRFVMLDDLRKNYKLKEKSKEEIYKLLGKVENDRCHYKEQISLSSSYHELCYEIEDGYIFFCLYFNKNGNVEKTYKWDAKNSYTYDES